MVAAAFWDAISQVAIALFGITAIILIAKKNKWGFVFGLISQPFWYITASIHGQWGVVFISMAYTCSWIFGVYQWFYRERKPKERAKSV